MFGLLRRMRDQLTVPGVTVHTCRACGRLAGVSRNEPGIPTPETWRCPCGAVNAWR